MPVVVPGGSLSFKTVTYDTAYVALMKRTCCLPDTTLTTAPDFSWHS